VTIGNGGRTMFVNSAYMAMTNRLTPYPGPGKGPPARADFSPQRGTPWAANPKVMLSPLGIPCNAPPWGKLTAIDLASRSIAWQRPLGTTRDHAPLGIAVPGAPNIAGSVATAGGLLFIGATIDNYIRAFDTRTGAELWRARLPAGGQAAPISYVSEKSGRQYIVIAAGGHMMLGTELGDYLIAYALPKKDKH
jgi:quinoprotein glucose dehydrogenase/quinate dehydrogenase (quinone)